MAKQSSRGGPRPGAGRPKTGSDNVSVKLDRAIIAKAKVIAAHRGITTTELLCEALTDPIDKAYAKMVNEMKAKG